jgi:hypothetical protein
MRFNDLKLEDQWFEIDLGDNKTFSINGEQKRKFIDSDSVVFELPDGEVVNKNFMRCIIKDIEKTKDELKKKPELPEKI